MYSFDGKAEISCHTILQKSFEYANLVLKKHFLLSSSK